MATRGFEFAYMLDGSQAVPLIRDLPVNGTGAYAIGDLVLLNSDGECAAVTASAGEVTGVIQEARASGSDGDLLKVAIITRNQVWRCSMDASTTLAVVGYTKTCDVADTNTLDADDIAGGSAIFVDEDLDDDGNVLAYVCFADTTFGNT